MILILKPTLACNLNCKYCYLEQKSKTANQFSLQFAKNILLQASQIIPPEKKIKILWHGGEPLLWGINNYKEIFPYIKKIFEGHNYEVTIQTNLTLVNEEFIELFSKYGIRVGCSLDGPKAIHDSQRTLPGGIGTFDIVMRNLALCREKGLRVGCIAVGTKKHIGKITALYEFMSRNGIHFKFNPMFSAGEAKKNIEEYGLAPNEYADMAIELFDLWFYDNKNKVSNPIFVDIASSLISHKKCSHCLFSKNCQDHVIAIAPNGSVVPCGRFCDDSLMKYAYGDLHFESLDTVIKKIKRSELYNRYAYLSKSSCGKCKYWTICHGGCLFDGYITANDFKSKTFLCETYKKIFSHMTQRLKETGLL